jgi:hypothetical protein
MKRLSLSAARRCETAATNRCKCRCGGLLHGKLRGDDAEFFTGLPRDDPHHAKPKRVSKPRVLKRDRVPPLFEGLEGNE